MIKHINTGLCHNRVQTGKPAFFVSWTGPNGTGYYFSSQRFAVEDMKRRLEQVQQMETRFIYSDPKAKEKDLAIFKMLQEVIPGLKSDIINHKHISHEVVKETVQRP